jgi:hypothetical protein
MRWVRKASTSQGPSPEGQRGNEQRPEDVALLTPYAFVVMSNAPAERGRVTARLASFDVRFP